MIFFLDTKMTEPQVSKYPPYVRVVHIPKDGYEIKKDKNGRE